VGVNQAQKKGVSGVRDSRNVTFGEKKLPSSTKEGKRKGKRVGARAASGEEEDQGKGGGRRNGALGMIRGHARHQKKTGKGQIADTIKRRNQCRSSKLGAKSSWKKSGQKKKTIRHKSRGE